MNKNNNWRMPAWKVFSPLKLTTYTETDENGLAAISYVSIWRLGLIVTSEKRREWTNGISLTKRKGTELHDWRWLAMEKKVLRSIITISYIHHRRHQMHATDSECHEGRQKMLPVVNSQIWWYFERFIWWFCDNRETTKGRGQEFR